MSTRYTIDVTCTRCGRLDRVEVADSYSVDRLPAVREWVLARTLMSTPCACGSRIEVDKPLLYSDVERGWWIQVVSPDRRPMYEVCETETRAEFTSVFDPSIFPPAIAALGAQLRVRVVFGHEELREKVLCADHDLDDALVEILKLELLVARPELLAAGVDILVLDGIVDRALSLVGLAADKRGQYHPAGEVRVARSAYDSLRSRRDELVTIYPALFGGTYVNALRYRSLG
ncbi:MAG: hypothetical protein JNL83_28855 [Myxococcales bacterium]|nr:hypothetical protein [Myxococcales bacterium]